MAQKTDADLLIQKQVIKAEGTNGANTKTRIGQMFEDIIDSKMNNGILIDEDNMATNSATRVPSQQSVKAYVDSISSASTDGTFVTGLAAGPGAAAANLAIIDAALSAVPPGERLIIPTGYWYVSGPIDITIYSKHIRLEIIGDLDFAAGNGIVVGNTTATPYLAQEVNVYGTLYGSNAGTTYGAFVDGVAFTINNATNGRYFINSAEGWKVAIQIQATGVTYTGSLHNHIRFGILDRNALNLHLLCTGAIGNFVNQNYFYGGNMAGGAGCKFTKVASQIDPFNGNAFYGCATEAIVTGICWDIDFAENNRWIAGRTVGAENPTSADRFKFSSTASYNQIIGYVLYSTDIDDSGSFNDFSNSRIIDFATGEETGMYYDWANKRLALGRVDDQHYPYFMPQATVDVRGNAQIRKDADYGYTGEDTYFYLGSSHVVSDGGVEKGYALRIEYTGAETPSILKLYAFTGFVGTAERFTVPTSDLTEVLRITEGKLTVNQLLLTGMNAAPASAAAAGTTGDIRVTSTHIYVCTATNTWKRVAIATW